MRRSGLGLVLSFLLSLLPASPTRADDAGVGKAVGNFSLKDAAGKAWSLDGLKDRKAVVVLFLGTECPVNNAYLPRLAELHKQYEPKGVQFLGVNANAQDSAARVAEHAKKFEVPFPVLKDEGNAVADQLGAQRTPEAFLLDGRHVVRYRGRIDDQHGIGFKRPAPTRRDLAEAMDEVLAGKDVSRPTAPVAGCLIGRAPKPKAEAQVTFTKHVARILQHNCQECHRPGQIGPMPLLTYDDAKAWSAMIREVVSEKRMPPWHADPRHGKFANDRRLPKADHDALLAWVEQGCAKGDDKDLPPPRQFAEGWRIGKPDVIFSMREAARVPAETPRFGVPYSYHVVETNFTEDKWVQAAEARPGNPAVVHHIIVYVMKRGQRPTGEDGIGNGFLVGHAPGDAPLVLQPGQAKRIPKDSLLVFQMHYTPNGKEQTDRSSVGLIFAKEPPAAEVKTRAISQPRLAIPPGEAAHKVTSQSTFRQDALLYSLTPHMHLRGKSFEYRVVYPDGKSDVLLSVPRFQFDWQTVYRLEKPLALPAGTRVECTAVFDNSEKNPNNPDPTKLVRWGDQTWDEMMIGFVDYAYVGKAGEK
jgi:peroxiredoxin